MMSDECEEGGCSCACHKTSERYLEEHYAGELLLLPWREHMERTEDGGGGWIRVVPPAWLCDALGAPEKDSPYDRQILLSRFVYAPNKHIVGAIYAYRHDPRVTDIFVELDRLFRFLTLIGKIHHRASRKRERAA